MQIQLKRLSAHFYELTVLHLVNFLQSHLGERAFLLVAAAVVGILSGSAAVLLKMFVHFLPEIPRWLSAHKLEPLTLLMPAFGIALAYGIQLILTGNRYEKSLSPLIYSIMSHRTTIRWRMTFSHILTAGISVGMGGSAGLEAPIVLTGAAIGSKVGSFFRVIHDHRSLLLGCGAAAGIAAIFDSPVAGVLFAAEVMIPTFTVGSLVPLLLSAALGVMISKVVLNSPHIFVLVTTDWNTDALLYYFILALICGMVGVYMIKVVYAVHKWLRHTLPTKGQQVLFGALFLVPVIFFFPMLYGEGYDAIRCLFSGHPESMVLRSPIYWLFPDPVGVVLILAVAAILLKVFAAVITINCGGDGGIFTPSIFTGAFVGFVFARLVNLSGLSQLQEPNFIAAGMCGVFVAVIRAPMTGIFLIVEITGGSVLLPPLMIVSAIAFFAARYFEPHSVYTKVLADQGLLPETERYNHGV